MSSPPDGPVRGKHARLATLVQNALAGQYRIEGELGHGGMAVVFRAFNLNLERPVAIKVMRPEKGYEEGVVSRFLTESVAIANLKHPNIIGVHNRGEAGEILWFEMDLVDGGSISDLIAKGPLPPDRAARYLAGAADALAYAHANGIIHRDIKPSNLLVDAKTDRVFVTDFGIAKLLGSSTLTDVGMTVGTVAYMSPEQLGVGRDLTAATDQYSLGVVAYEMITGARPFSADTPVQFAVIQSTRTLPPLRSRTSSCPRDLAVLTERMLARDPADRWPDLTTVKRAAEEIAVTGSSRIVRVHRAPARRSRRRAAIAAAALIVIGAGGWVIWPKRESVVIPPPPPPPPSSTTTMPVTTTPPPPSAVIPGPSTTKLSVSGPGRSAKPTVSKPDSAARSDIQVPGQGGNTPDTARHSLVAPPPPPAALTTVLYTMRTRTPGTLASLNGGTPYVLSPGKPVTLELPPGPLRIVVHSTMARCVDAIVVDTLRLGRPKSLQLDPDCPN